MTADDTPRVVPAGEGTTQRAETPGTPAATGHPAVDAVVASLDGLDDVPLDEHVSVFETAHEQLRVVLADGGAGEPA